MITATGANNPVDRRHWLFLRMLVVCALLVFVTKANADPSYPSAILCAGQTCTFQGSDSNGATYIWDDTYTDECSNTHGTFISCEIYSGGYIIYQTFTDGQPSYGGSGQYDFDTGEVTWY